MRDDYGDVFVFLSDMEQVSDMLVFILKQNIMKNKKSLNYVDYVEPFLSNLNRLPTDVIQTRFCHFL